MKKRKNIWNITLSIFISSLTLFAIGCRDDVEPTTGTVTVYTTSPNNWSLIIDDVEYGKIKRASQMPVCGDPEFQNITLKKGIHSFDAKSLDGYAWGKPKSITVVGGQCVQVKLP